MFEKGLVHVYTGDGKGKTTAAFGLALRAAGHGARVLIYQFLKPPFVETGELAAIRQIRNITIRQIDQPWDMRISFDDKQAVTGMRNRIGEAIEQLIAAAADRRFDMIILDEIIFCLDKKLADIADIKRLMEKMDNRVEIIMTGRDASDELIALADLVTEMKKIKHPFDNGLKARKGIEF